MIKIGIIGNSGSGKTTFSKYLNDKYPNVSYLSVDDITISDEELHATRDGILWDIYNNSLSTDEIKRKQFNFRRKLSKAIIEELEKIEDSKERIVIIDYIVLHTMPELWNNLQYKILVNRENEKRREGLLKREGEEHMGPLDSFVKFAGINDKLIDTDFTVENNGSIEELNSQAEKIFNEIQSQNKENAPSRHYSYYIVKPDGIRHFKEIYSSLQNIFEGMSSVRFFKINNYSEIMTNLYYKLFEKYPEYFEEVFNTFKMGMNSLYGNEGILILMSEVHKTEKEYQDFLKKILDNKLEIRKNIMDPNVRMATKLSDNSKLRRRRST